VQVSEKEVAEGQSGDENALLMYLAGVRIGDLYFRDGIVHFHGLAGRVGDMRIDFAPFAPGVVSFAKLGVAETFRTLLSVFLP
jgi:hypothetical protein